MVKINIPKEIDIDITVSSNTNNSLTSKEFSKEIEERRKVFSGEDFKL